MKRKLQEEANIPNKELKTNNDEDNIEDIKTQFYQIDEQILELESKRQSLLHKLKEDSRTRISFSNVRRYEKTKV